MARRAIEPLCVAVLLASCLFGGSSEPGRRLMAIPQLLGLPLLVLALLPGADKTAAPRNTVWLAAAILLLPLLQLVPLPPWIWSALPGRAAVGRAYAAAGIAPTWLPLTLTPFATEQVWLGLLPAVALFLAVPTLAVDARRRLMHLAVAIGVLDVILGFGQLVGGESSPLRFYATASRTDAVGVFANRNHQALFLAVLILLAGTLAVGRSRTAAERLWLAGAGTLLLLGIVASGSRAGVVLAIGACLATVWTLVATRAHRRERPAHLVWRIAAPLVLLLGFATIFVLPHVDQVAGDLRWQIQRTTWQAILRVFPVGAGFGSFERVYAQVERPDELIAPIINNAHDDWLEVTLEGGLPALLLLLAAMGYLVRETLFTRIGEDGPAYTRAVLSATLAAFWLCALHSIVDYPLRTMAVNVLLALACGLRVGARGDSREPVAAGRLCVAAEPSCSPGEARSRRRPARVAVRCVADRAARQGG